MADYTAYTLTYDAVSPDNLPLVGADISAVIQSAGFGGVLLRATFPVLWENKPVKFVESGTEPGTYTARLVPNTSLPGRGIRYARSRRTGKPSFR